MARKTVSVEYVRERANTFLATSDDDMAGMRRGVAALLEAVLFETNNYKGFNYLASEKDDKGLLKPDGEYDDTRRVYY